jgi:micrococcal nuclease
MRFYSISELKTVCHKYLCFPYRKMSDELKSDTLYNKTMTNTLDNLEHRMSLRDLMFLENANVIDAIQFIPPVKYGKVVKVYDGDTITIVATLDFGVYQSPQLYKFSVRLTGIDCPEIKTKNENEKKLAIIARDELKKKLDNKIVELKNVSLEKYGRLLADVFVGDICVNEWMVTNGYAVKYDGGTKERPEEWER